MCSPNATTSDRLGLRPLFGAAGLLLGLAAALGCGSGNPPRTEKAVPASVIEGRFTPPPGRTLLIVGQDLDSIHGYVEATGRTPGGVTTYTDLSEGEHESLLSGLFEPADWGAGRIHAVELVSAYPESSLAIGLFIVDRTGSNLARIADGTHDAAIDRLGAFIRNAERPVFLRVGYEFDGPWNHYEPEPYVAAFRHIVDRLRARGVDQFATIWQSFAGSTPRYGGHPVTAWYPGDDYVDWFGTSWFEAEPAAQEAFLALAREHGKPVLIAEAAPRGFDLERLTFSPVSDGRSFTSLDADSIWAGWYEPFFRYVHENADVIRAVAYINADWKSQAMWTVDAGNGYWGDSRIQANARILDRWKAEISGPSWLHGGPGLIDALNRNSQAP